ncbi:MAG TPA: DEAD/DEAH box helicase [Steroidobacteraceae bacterium]|nr:DEAD/DEAH box helicase [Steroidobacteraceae bacterium]
MNHVRPRRATGGLSDRDAARYARPMRPLELFHPAVAAWFARRFEAPTSVQAQAWPAIQSGRHVLIAAPTGSGKTFAAFLAVLDQLVREGLAGELADATRVVYVSPLKALSNDIQHNLAEPLAGIGAELARLGLPPVAIRTSVRTGDTPARERLAMRRTPPHVVVTTPESLYILLGSESGRTMLATTRAVILDEIHAVTGSKRGAHLALSLERLEALTRAPLTRIGLSATQAPIEEVARFLLGAHALDPSDPRKSCTVIDAGHARRRDLALELPPAPLEAVMSGEVWSQVYDRLAELVREHRTVLVFVNTRRLAERVARHLSERLGATNVRAHHGSLARERRLEAEQRLKRGELKVLVATASLELGIDIGEVDLVCQLGSPRSINALLQRVGRSGHAVGGLSKGRLFPLSRDELVECAALLDAVRRGELDRLSVPPGALDVLSQQIAAEVASGEWAEEALYHCLKRAYPYRDLSRGEFDEVVSMLDQGFTSRRGRHGALLHRDAVNRMLRPRRGARLTALTSGGAIPDAADYQVVLDPSGQLVGTVNEDFAVESLAGDIFQLGNTSYRILRIERGAVRVADAEGAPPSIPFWLGEAPGRTDALSRAVSQLRREIDRRLGASREGALAWVIENGLGEPAAAQLIDYLAGARAALGCLPTQETIALERFFDESGGMQLIVHAPFGSRVNRAWGLSLRKRFCRTFNFELQAAATEDAIVLSLTAAHSFELAQVARYLHANTVRDLLVQAVCAAPMFVTRWRWVAQIALALPRFRGGRRVPPPLARMRAEDLLAAVFPDQVACAENLTGEREIPDHPLVRQTLRDCLTEAMDIEGFEALLGALHSGAIRVVACDLTEPSPLALEVLAARPYAYLDDAPLEERRTQAVMSRRWLDPATAAELGRLDAQAIDAVRVEAWPDATSADELHAALCSLGFLTATEVRRNRSWPALLDSLAADGRIVQLMLPQAASGRSASLVLAAERRALFEALFPEGRFAPLVPTLAPERAWTAEEALIEIVRGRLEGLGPITASALADSLALTQPRVDAALAALQAEGFVMRGRFTGAAGSEEWCERGLLARIHRRTVKRLRAEVTPVEPSEFLRFLSAWQHVTEPTRMQGPDAVAHLLGQLEGFEAAAGAWETQILPARLGEYEPEWLDENCRAGRFVWTRLGTHAAAGQGAGPLRSTPIAIIPRRNMRFWAALAAPPDPQRLSAGALAVSEFLADHGASFFDEIVDGARLLPAQAEEALAALVAQGAVNSDGFAGLRALLGSGLRRSHSGRAGRSGERARRIALQGLVDSGRWALVRRASPAERTEATEHLVRTLLRRWGVLLFRLLARESAWLPPWREILLSARRLEARGEIRGGRFVGGFSGEQYAAPDAIGLLREVRRGAGAGELVSLSGADPLNVVGLLTAGARLPAVTTNRVLYREGLPLALLQSGEVRFLQELDPPTQWASRQALLRGKAVAAAAAARPQRARSSVGD